MEIGINNQAVYDFFLHDELELKEEGFFTNIIELFPSHNLILNLNSHEIKIERYYSLKPNTYFEDYNEKSYSTFVKTIEEKIVNAIKIRLRSDVAVGSCLSGGIDSSAIAGIAASLNPSNPLQLFTATFPQQAMDESNWAKLVAHSINSKWHTVTPNSDELIQELKNLIYCQDIPIWSTSTFAQYSVMKLVNKNGIKVVLDGQGGDELFSGYLPYFTYYWNDIVSNKGLSTALKEIKFYKKLPQALKYWITEEAKKSKNGIIELYKQKNKHVNYFNSSFVNQYKLTHASFPKPQSLNEHLANEFSISRLKGYLKCEDRCAMWFSVESRTPFADDIELIEMLFSISGNYKMKNGITKTLLRDSTKKYLPEPIYNRKDKMGYVTPHNQWLFEQKDAIIPYFNKNLEGYIDLKKLTNSLNHLLKNPDHLSNEESAKENTFLFKTLAFSVWREVFEL